MIRIACNHHITSLARGAFGEMLYASHKRARRIDHFGRALLELVLYLWRDSVRANHRDCDGVSFVRRADRRDATSAESLHLLRVVNEWSKRANRARAFFDYLFDHLDRALDTETETEFLCE